MESRAALCDGVTIVVPWKMLRDISHNKGNPIFKAGPVRRLRAYAKTHALVELRGRTKKVNRVTYSFYVPDNRRRDEINMLQNCKPVVDGVVDSGMLEDDCWQMLRLFEPPMIAIDKANPRIEICFFEATSG
ncbi:MAG: hypothetical protein ACK5XN_21710 [Bacteroidota bacterium]